MKINAIIYLFCIIFAVGCQQKKQTATNFSQKYIAFAKEILPQFISYADSNLVNCDSLMNSFYNNSKLIANVNETEHLYNLTIRLNQRSFPCSFNIIAKENPLHDYYSYMPHVTGIYNTEFYDLSDIQGSTNIEVKTIFFEEEVHPKLEQYVGELKINGFEGDINDRSKMRSNAEYDFIFSILIPRDSLD